MNDGYTEAEALQRIGDTDIHTDWRSLVTRQGITHKDNLSFSGGKDGIRYRFSGSYFNMKSIGKGNELNRITTRLNLTTDLTDKLNWNFILGVSHMKKNAFDAFSALSFRPNLSPYNEDGSFNNEAPFDNLMNPMAGLAQNENWVKNFYTNGSTRLSYQIMKGLKISSTFGVDLNADQTYVFHSKKNAMGARRGGYIARLGKNNMKWISFTQADYNFDINDVHHFDALAGFQVEDRTTELLKGTNSNIPFEKIRELGISETEDSKTHSSLSTFGSVSYYGRFSYNYDNKYHANFSYRSDAASVFGGDQQKENFASVGLSWVLTREKWFDDINFLDFLKLRGSYGNTGNSRIGTYAALGLYQYSDRYGYDGILGAQPLQAPNAHLTWEKNHKLNLAVDLRLFKQLSVTVERYVNNIKDGISNMNVPLESGFYSIPVNTADMRNSGWEFSVTSAIIETEDLSWNVSFNIASNQNEIVSLGNNKNFIKASSYNSAGLIIGEDVTSILALRYAGVNPQTGEAQYYLADGSITTDASAANKPENRVIVGKSAPDAYGGLSTTLDYKNFSITAMVSYEAGGKLMLPYRSFLYNSDGDQILIHNQSVNQLDRWQKPGDITDIPRLSTNNGPVKNTTRNLYDKTNIEFDNISVSYTLPERWLKTMRMDYVRFNFNVDNLGYWYKEDSDPNRNGIAEYRFPYPVSRTYTLGVNIKF